MNATKFSNDEGYIRIPDDVPAQEISTVFSAHGKTMVNEGVGLRLMPHRPTRWCAIAIPAYKTPLAERSGR